MDKTCGNYGTTFRNRKNKLRNFYRRVFFGKSAANQDVFRRIARDSGRRTVLFSDNFRAEYVHNGLFRRAYVTYAFRFGGESGYFGVYNRSRSACRTSAYNRRALQVEQVVSVS